ncbi:hypothetical protein L596_016733 [Steinernema carpocapsae]|uniref:Sulfotransferase domain-containing protein n=1 Tax=Steinernema carpocapsae TaxID=34508 RepID=A0A4U5NK50_STECR|nr:hypothetical protein L596_016733 [Steinernema carpocapsae]
MSIDLAVGWTYVHEFFGTVVYLSHLLFVRFFSAIQLAYRYLNQTAKIPPGYGRVCNILFKRKRVLHEMAWNSDFVTVHASFEPLDSLLNGYWSLYCLDKTHAILVKLPKPVVEYQSKDYPFMFAPLFRETIRVAYVTIDDFVAYCAKLNNKPQPRTVFFTNTPRCGSTILVQMLCHKNVSVCYGEPPCLMNLSLGMDNGYYTQGVNILNKSSQQLLRI